MCIVGHPNKHHHTFRRHNKLQYKIKFLHSHRDAGYIEDRRVHQWWESNCCLISNSGTNVGGTIVGTIALAECTNIEVYRSRAAVSLF